MPAKFPHTDLNSLRFDNRFIRELPGDPESDNYRRQVYGSCYSLVQPTPVKQPKLIAYSAEMAAELELSSQICETEEFANIFTGNVLAKGMQPYACCYGGHQFGHWAGQLGDGRAINLGEIVNKQGNYLTLQLKGAGLTPYSRSADGLAVLRSSIREFLCSEAMHHLGVPTTRALSVILTGEQVQRDMFYDGNPQLEPGAIVCRVAPTFTRFGSFEIFAARDELENLKKLVDYTISHDFPHLSAPCPTVYIEWFQEVCKKTAEMIVHWQRVGFVHGVMNTDNMSILGLTIDYGPYGWLENYDPDWTPNTTDAQSRRYRFGNQPKIAYWNLVKLANAIYPLIKRSEPLQEALTTYTSSFEQGWLEMMTGKLGLLNCNADRHASLIADVLALLQTTEADMTLFFRGLANVDSQQTGQEFITWLESCCYIPLTSDHRIQAAKWLEAYQAELLKENRTGIERSNAMNAVNPLYVFRNYLAQLAIDQAEQGDFSQIVELLEVLRHPYQEQTGKEHYAAKRPDWAKQRAGCSMLSCSS